MELSQSAISVPSLFHPSWRYPPPGSITTTGFAPSPFAGKKVKNGSFMSVTTRLRCHSSCSRFVIGLSPAFIGTFPSGHSLVSAAGSCLQSSAMSAARASGVSVSAQ